MNNKGKYAIIGAVVGLFCTCLLGVFNVMNFDDLIFLYIPGAFIGAFIGYACAGKKESPENPEHPVRPNTELQEKTAVSELLDYKKLLDAGIITQEEFDKKKEELLKEL